jgi:uncharacterized protein
MSDNSVVTITRAWVDSVVVGLNLCPFARREIATGRVRFAATAANSEESLLEELQAELELLDKDNSVETTLLIHPNTLQKFSDYNQFLERAEELLRRQGFEGTYQIASFHPDYQFSQTGEDDAENYTNRSPFPMLHIIKEESIRAALDNYPDSGEIPERNIRLLQNMGYAKVQALLQSCFELKKGSE